MPQFQILGTAAGTGVPSFFCQCKGCQEARDNLEYSRTRSGALVRTGVRNILIDASPDLRNQLVREGIAELDWIFLTHWHYDHFGGLGELEFYVKLQHIDPLPLYLPPSAVQSFMAAYPHLKDVFDVLPWRFFARYHIDETIITPLPANHGIETAGFLIETGRNRLAYFPDTAGLPAASMKEIQGVDWLLCDATFNDDNWYPESHMSVEQAISLSVQVKARNTLLTHLSIHYSRAVTTKELESQLAEYPNLSLAKDGMLIDL
ncbi:MAG TPA: MBL fold metallo-hydrolase [Syntrophomonadaceae bacterium]|nr:MBL fold metallo-hydrolase [Syntrophomonadaceae bacterium]